MEQDTEQTESYCPACDCLNEPMGGLGNILHFNCRDCGVWYQEKKES